MSHQQAGQAVVRSPKRRVRPQLDARTILDAALRLAADGPCATRIRRPQVGPRRDLSSNSFGARVGVSHGRDSPASRPR